MGPANAIPPPGRTVHRATLARVVEHHPGTRSLFLTLAAGRRLDFMPGQFVSCELPQTDGPRLVRPYSLASSPEDDELEICVDVIAGGPGSSYLFGLEPGAGVDFTGPFGSFALGDPPAESMVFVAEGTAIAPIRPMVRRALERGGEQIVEVVQGARYEHELLFRDEFEQWARTHPRMRWEPVLRTTEAEHGPLAALEELVVERFVRSDQERHRRFWICTVGPLAGRLRDTLRAAGYERRSVRAEEW